MAGAGLSQGRCRFCGRRNAFAGQVQISGQAQYFCKVRCRVRAGAGLLQDQVQTSWQAQVRYKFGGRRRSGTNSPAGTALEQGQVQIRTAQHRFRGTALSLQGTVPSLTQAQHFRKQ